MATLVAQLSRLSDEIARDNILVYLSVKDLSSFEIAMSNKPARDQFRRWCHNMRLTTFERFRSPLVPLFNWLQEREIILEHCFISKELDDAAMRSVAAIPVRIEKFHKFGMPSKAFWPAVVDFLASRTTLKSVEISEHSATNAPIESWEAFLRNNTSRRVCPQPDAQMVRSVAAFCPQMKDLSLDLPVIIDENTVILLAQCCPLLISLELQTCTEVTNRALFAISEHCVHITVLKLVADGLHVSDLGLVQLLQHDRLQQLHLSDDSYFGDDADLVGAVTTPQPAVPVRPLSAGCVAVTPLTRQLHNLQVFVLNVGTGISQRLLLSILQHSPELTSLELPYSKLVDDSVLSALATGCPKVTSINIGCCQNVTDLHTLHSLPVLQEVFADGCKGLTDASLVTLAATPGPLIIVNAMDGGISAEAAKHLQGSKRVHLPFLLSTFELGIADEESIGDFGLDEGPLDE